MSGEASAVWAVFGLFFGAGRALGSVLLPGASPCGELPEAEAEAVGRILFPLVAETAGILLVRWPVVERQVHGRNALIRQNHAIIREIQFMAMIEVALVVEIAVKDTRPVLDDCSWPRRCHPASIDEVNRQPVPLPRGASCLQDEALLTDTLIVGVVRGMKDHARLATPLD